MNRGAWWAAVHGVAQSQTRLKQLSIIYKGASQVAQWVKNLPANAGDTGDPVSIPRLGEGNGNPLQYSCLENSINSGEFHQQRRIPSTGDRSATVHSVTKNQT